MAAMEDRRPRLTYFAGWGLAEQTRWMLAAAGVEFSQVALRSHAEFEALRASGRLLFNQLPLLELDGLDLTQSQAMVRYVARRHGMDGGSAPADAAKVDMLCEGVRDARGVVVGFPFSPDPAEYRAEAPARLARHLPFFERALAGGGFAVEGHELTAADVLLAELVEGAYARAERSLLSLSLSERYDAALRPTRLEPARAARVLGAVSEARRAPSASHLAAVAARVPRLRPSLSVPGGRDRGGVQSERRHRAWSLIRIRPPPRRGLGFAAIQTR